MPFLKKLNSYRYNIELSLTNSLKNLRNVFVNEITIKYHPAPGSLAHGLNLVMILKILILLKSLAIHLYNDQTSL